MRPESTTPARLNARSLRRELTEAERALWRRLRRRQFLDARFRRQVPIGPYIADFACLKSRLIIELDGSQHVEAASYDTRRDAFLGREGFTVLRFWNGDVLARPDSVMEAIFVALDRVRLRHPPSALRAPSPSGGR
ncbi:MAG: endonuclease domain-containing protein [Alphaproteobacteria bacterium]|nr:endonuclease domain-containing protein [Alphaproteobacteria bacterium]MCW5740628.1 endonuclease domain-containing protein [Alphaproteobacteria bacterium]